MHASRIVFKLLAILLAALYTPVAAGGLGLHALDGFSHRRAVVKPTAVPDGGAAIDSAGAASAAHGCPLCDHLSQPRTIQDGAELHRVSIARPAPLIPDLLISPVPGRRSARPRAPPE